MIEGLRPYPEYRESGLPWLPSVPCHWQINRLKTIFREVDERSATGKESLLSLRMNSGLVDHHLMGGRRILPSALVNYKRAYPGQIVMNRMRASMGLFGIPAKVGLVSPDYAVLSPLREIVLGYYLQLFKSPILGRVFRMESRGLGTGESGFLRLYFDTFGVLSVPLPPPDEQTAIVRFLDHANRKIDGFIRAKRKLIALLNEQKQAIIHRAVTRGLNPNVPLKPSGIPWLGDIPQHWEVMRLGRAINLVTGFPFKSEGFTQKDSAVRLLRGINVTPAGLRWDATVLWERTQNDGLEPFELGVGDVVLGMDRPVIASGVRAARIEENDVPSMLLQRVARLRPTERLDGGFLLVLLRGKFFADYIAPIFTGISVPHLSPDQIRGFKVMLPPKPEQEEVVRHIESGFFRIQRVFICRDTGQARQGGSRRRS